MTTYPNLPQRRPVASRLFAVVSLLLALCLVPVAAAQENPGKKAYDIPADDAERALKTFAHQSGLEVLFVTEATQGVRTLAVKGEYTPREALDQLLAGTPLTATQSGPTGAFKVRREKSVELAEKNVASRASRDRAADLDEKKEDVVKLDTFEVFGRKTLNMDVPRFEDGVQPYIILDRQEIARSGATNVGELLLRQLPMNTSTSNGGFLGSSGNNSSVNLRGLGVDHTLILVDGRRLPGISQSGAPVQPDLNGIPLGAIDRIEVLPTTASGTYGGSATGGVVNVVLRRDYQGAELRLSYDNTFDTDSAIRSADLYTGFNLESGKTKVLLSVSYSDRNFLTTQDRDFQGAGISLLLARNPQAIFGVQNPPLGRTTNIRSTSGLLTLKPAYGGGALGSNVTFVPAGYAGPTADNGAGLIANAGRYNFDLADTTQAGAARRPLTSSATTRRYGLTVRREMGRRWQVFLDGSFSDTRTSARYTQATGTFSLTAAALGNPFAQPIRVTTPVFNAESDSSFTAGVARFAGGLILEIRPDWKVEVDHTWGITRYKFGGPSGSSTALLSTAAAAVSGGQIDVFRDTNVFGADFSSHRGPSTVVSVNESYLHDTALRVAGNLFDLPGGTVTVSSAVQFLHSGIGDYVQQTTTPSISPSRSQDVQSAYAELTFPLVSPQQGLPAVNKLQLQASGRVDRYKSVGAPTNISATAPVVRTTNRASSSDPTIGFLYEPVEGLAFRGSYGTGFLAPGVAFLVPNPPQFIPVYIGINDPRRGNEPVTNFSIKSGGNADLRPEESETRTAGLVLQPSRLKGLRISADWVHIEKKNGITIPSADTTSIAANEALIPGFITRAAPSPGDPFGVGQITEVSLQWLNAFSLVTEAVDFAASYRSDLSRRIHLDLSLNATKYLGYEERLLPASTPVERVGTGSYPDWRGTASASLSVSEFTVGWAGRFVSAYWRQSDHAVDPNYGTARAPDEWYHDLLVRYKNGPRGPFGDFTVQAGVRNIFDKEPAPQALLVSGVSLEARQRSYSLSITKEF